MTDGEGFAMTKEEKPRNDREGSARLPKGRGEFSLPGFDQIKMSILVNPEIASSLRSSQ